MAKHSIMNSEGFGISNGVSTIIALLAGFVAAYVSKVPVVSAMISLLLTDPLSDSYSIYISMKDTDKDEAFRKFMGTFKTQLFIQALFLIIVVLSPSIYLSFIISCVIGLIMVLYDFNKRLKDKKEILIELSKIVGIIILVFVVNKSFL